MPVQRMRRFEDVKWQGFFRIEKNGPSYQRINLAFNGKPNARNFHNPNETLCIEPSKLVFVRIRL